MKLAKVSAAGIANSPLIKHISTMAKSETYRSALTGRLVPAPATKSNKITVRDAQGFATRLSDTKGRAPSLEGKYATEPLSQKAAGTYRSAVSGRFVTSEFGTRHPKTTVKESVGNRKD